MSKPNDDRNDRGESSLGYSPNKQITKPCKKLSLVVDKTRFICNAAIFNHHPMTLLGKMFSAQMLRPGNNAFKFPIDNTLKSRLFFRKF